MSLVYTPNNKKISAALDINGLEINVCLLLNTRADRAMNWGCSGGLCVNVPEPEDECDREYCSHVIAMLLQTCDDD